jgi:hypothetical protein
MSDAAPDRPPVPRSRRGGVITVYAVIAAAIIGAWVFAGATGWAFGTTSSHDEVPPSMRSSPGGYRAFHFWHSGYQGGK